MDATTFDQLIKRLATTRLTRLTALRGLAAGGVAALTGVRLFSEDGRAKKPNRNPQRFKVCLCSPASCKTVAKKKEKVKKLLKKNACAYKGKCTLVNPCVATLTPLTPTPPPPPPGFNCTTAGCVGERAGLICDTGTGQCVNCTSYTQCGSVTGAGARACLAGLCRGGEACTSDPQCFNPLFCLNPVLDLTRLICQFDNECDADTGTNGCTSTPATPICVLGYCTQACVPGDDCGPGKSCQGGVCLFT
jgi:hypothetical protein